jgi:hypothetical protein
MKWIALFVMTALGLVLLPFALAAWVPGELSRQMAGAKHVMPPKFFFVGLAFSERFCSADTALGRRFTLRGLLFSPAGLVIRAWVLLIPRPGSS